MSLVVGARKAAVSSTFTDNRTPQPSHTVPALYSSAASTGNLRVVHEQFMLHGMLYPHQPC